MFAAYHQSRKKLCSYVFLRSLFITDLGSDLGPHCRAKKDHLGISESKTGMLEQTEKNCYQACLHWFLGEFRCERRRLEI